jgi:hypothetical protein
MNKAKTYACWFAALAGLFVIGSLIQSRESQAKGAYSSPVTVMNTTANPGSVLDASRASRAPYQSMVQMNCGNGVFTCEFPFTTAPSGFRLVVENVSGGLNIVAGSPAPVVSLVDGSGNGYWAFIGALGLPTFLVNAGFNQTLRAYFDPTDGQPFVVVAGNFQGTIQRVTLSGYLENCAVVGCPAVQH